VTRETGPPLLRLTLLMLALLSAGSVAGCAAGDDPRPHVVFVTWDSARADHLSAYGYERPTTPALDAVAASSVQFDRAIAQHNWTLPSYASIFTSLHNWEFPGLQWGPSNLTLAEVLRENGFATVGVVQNPNLSREFHFAQGFDTYREHAQGLSAREITEVALDSLRSLPAGDRRPVFLFVHYQGPHLPYPADGELVADFLPPDSVRLPPRRINRLLASHGDDWDPGAPDAAAEVRYILALYDADLRATDAAFGGLVEGLEQQGLWERTLLVFNSDHGEEFNDRGSFGHAHENLHPELTRVPLIIRFPPDLGVAPTRVAAPVQNLDIFPTVLDALGIDVPGGLSGRSLLPLDELGSSPRLAFSNVGRLVMIRAPGASLLADFEDGPGYRFYDTDADPQERRPVERPEGPLFRRLREAALVWHQVFQRNAEADPADPAPPPSPELMRRLRALGYLR